MNTDQLASEKLLKERSGLIYVGAQWLSGRVLDLRSRGCRFEPHRHHCIMS